MVAHSPIDVSILVVSYNTRAMTADALTSIRAETKSSTYEVIVVDNASSDGSAEMIANHPVQPKVMALAENIGFARANNLAASKARGRYILLLNPDTIVLDNAIDRLVAFARAEPQARIWGGRTVFADGSLNKASCWSRMTAWSLISRACGLAAVFPETSIFNSEALGGWKRDSVRQVDIVSGCFLLIERELWNRLGGFDPLFFMYGEEADLCLRARSFDARPIITPAATIIHYGGASERVRSDKMVRLLAAKSSLIARHWPAWSVPIGQCLLGFWPLSRLIASKAAALVTRSPNAVITADTWSSVWRRRFDWLTGYRAVVVAMPPIAPVIGAQPVLNVRRQA